MGCDNKRKCIVCHKWFETAYPYFKKCKEHKNRVQTKLIKRAGWEDRDPFKNDLFSKL